MKIEKNGVTICVIDKWPGNWCSTDCSFWKGEIKVDLICEKYNAKIPFWGRCWECIKEFGMEGTDTGGILK